ncbi:fumarylacetoacetate hydrolase family protein [Pseudomonas putida]|jgi:2-keto-4-pentenoate hydratase|nr:fumarylacetoacetate hydrolase family protein [Pseudomonas putida]
MSFSLATVAEVTAELELAAMALAHARQQGVRLACLPETSVPRTLAQGFAIQQRVGPLAGKFVGGWKCALPPSGKWIVAPLYEDAIVEEGQYRLPCDATGARIEPELACVLADGLPARGEPYTAQDIIAAIGSVHLALEVIDCRYTDPQSLPFEHLLADGLFNHGLVLGPPISVRASDMPSELNITVRDATADRATLKGRHPDGNPLLPVVWLANFLSAQGIGLQAGQVIITGSYAGVLDVPINQPLRVQFGNAGSLSVNFSTFEE